MEYENTIRGITPVSKTMRLNPCSNGIRKYLAMANRYTCYSCLNPCSNGIRKYALLYFVENNNES